MTLAVAAVLLLFDADVVVEALVVELAAALAEDVLVFVELVELGLLDDTEEEAELPAMTSALETREKGTLVQPLAEVHFWYKLRAFGPPQYSVLLPPQGMLQLPSTPGCGAAQAGMVLSQKH